jgi:hypothetical protein
LEVGHLLEVVVYARVQLSALDSFPGVPDEVVAKPPAERRVSCVSSRVELAHRQRQPIAVSATGYG